VAPVEVEGATSSPQLFRQPLAGGAATRLTEQGGGLSVEREWRAPRLDRLFFLAGDVLWASDGTVEGTRRILVAGGIEPLGSVLEVADGHGFALAWAGQPDGGERTLYGIDVQHAEAVRLAVVPVHDRYGGIEWAATAEAIVFASADRDGHTGPWRSNGTVAGTYRLADAGPGPPPSSPHAFTSAADGSFFVASTIDAGAELWFTDGTAAGTALVADLAAGPGSSSPEALVVGPDRLLFAADDGVSGREPWTIGWTVAARGGSR
jgi:ELWxxDGT repeat protein